MSPALSLFRRVEEKLRPFHFRLWIIYALVFALIVGIDGADRLLLARRCEEYSREYDDAQRRLLPVVEKLSCLNKPILAHSLTSGYRSGNDALTTRLLQTVEDHLRSFSWPVTRSDVEKALGLDKPLVLKPVHPGLVSSAGRLEVALHWDKEGEAVIKLYFCNGLYQSYDVVDRSPPEPASPFWIETCRELGTSLWKAYPVIWLCLLPLVLIPRLRGLTGELLLGVSFSYLMGHLPHPVIGLVWFQAVHVRILGWPTAMVCASLTIMCWIWCRHERASRVRCPVCEYNLSGNTSGICPECGSAVPAPIRERLDRIQPVLSVCEGGY